MIHRHSVHHPCDRATYSLTIAAAILGMDERIVNGEQIWNQRYIDWMFNMNVDERMFQEHQYRV
jgi:hypothetical protein